jgi:hypothetical protein
VEHAFMQLIKAESHIIAKGNQSDWMLFDSVLGGIWFKLGKEFF